MGEGGNAVCCSGHIEKYSFVVFSQKICGVDSGFCYKATDFQVTRVHVLFLPSISCVENAGVFSSALEVIEGICCPRGKMRFGTAPS